MSQPTPHRLPDFLLIGGQRCGTTWTLQCLIEHPDVYVPASRRGITLSAEQVAEYADQPVIGIVNSELLYDASAARAIAKGNPGAKIVALVRNPIDRAFSFYVKSVREGESGSVSNPVYERPISFERALIEDPKLIDHGRYYQHLEPYLEHIPTDKRLVLLYDDLDADPAKFLKESVLVCRIRPRLSAFCTRDPRQLLRRQSQQNNP